MPFTASPGYVAEKRQMQSFETYPDAKNAGAKLVRELAHRITLTNTWMSSNAGPD